MIDYEYKQAKIQLVEQALYSLNFSALNAAAHLQDWFVIAFNEWFTPLFNQHGTMPFFAVFDFGLTLVGRDGNQGTLPPGMVEERFRRYQHFLRALPHQPLMQRARTIWNEAIRSGRANARADVGRILVGAPFQDGVFVPGCPDPKRFEEAATSNRWTKEERAHLDECPRCSKAKELGKSAKKAPRKEAYDSRNFVPPVIDLHPMDHHRIVIQSVGVISSPETLGKIDLEIPPFQQKKPHPTFWLPEAPDHVMVPSPVRLFLGHVACYEENAESLVDTTLVEECLLAPSKSTQKHEPPRTHTTTLLGRAPSILPGAIAGTSRVETKTDLDSWLDILPQEFALMLCNRTAGMLKLLEKPLIYKREREQDRVPRLCALVCFLLKSADTHQASASSGETIDQHRYNILGKRQAFDLLRDLRQAIERLRNRALVDIDTAIFVVRGFNNDALIHRQFGLEQFSPSMQPDEHLSRLDQMIRFGTLVPRYFDRLGESPSGFARRHSDRERMVASMGRYGARDIVDPQVGRFLRKGGHGAPSYHAEFIIPIGTVDQLRAIVPAGATDARLAPNVRRQVMLMTVHPDRQEPDPRLPEEPGWSLAKVRNLRDAARLVSSDDFARAPLQPLVEVRLDFLTTVLGPVESARRNRPSIPLAR